MRNRPFMLIAMACALLMSGCVRSKAAISQIRPYVLELWDNLVMNGTRPGDPVLARVGYTHSVITASNLQGRFNTLPEPQKVQFLTSKGPENLLQGIINQRVFALVGRQAGIESDPQFRQQMQDYRYVLLTTYQQRYLLSHGLRVTDAEIQKYYTAHKGYKPRLTIMAHEILVNSLANAKKAQDQLKKKPFEEVAREMSVDKIRGPNGGRLPPIVAGTSDPAHEEILRSLSIGQLSKIAKGPEGYYLLRKDDERFQAPPLEIIQEEIRRTLEREKLTGWVKNVRKLAPVEIDQKALADINFTATTSSTPAAIRTATIPQR